MKGIYKIGGITIFATQLIFGCGIKTTKEEIKTMNIEGIVLSEEYNPYQNIYVFVIDTGMNKKAVYVTTSYDNFSIRPEGINALIEKGTRVKIEIDKEKLSQQVYSIAANRIKILEK